MWSRSAGVFQEEIFGSVLTVTPFADEAEAIELANATPYGLAAGVWTESQPRAMRCARAIVSGYVWVNMFNTTPIEAPFGGTKSSGFGRGDSAQATDLCTTWKTVAFATAPFEDWYASQESRERSGSAAIPRPASTGEGPCPTCVRHRRPWTPVGTTRVTWDP
jgi:hypothetical protein